MSEQKKPEKEAPEADGSQPEELSEEQLESVAGGVLIGLNVGTIAHKDLVATVSEGLEYKVPAASAVVDTTFKFKK